MGFNDIFVNGLDRINDFCSHIQDKYTKRDVKFILFDRNYNLFKNKPLFRLKYFLF